ncbi:MAG: Hpt domain-containing protein [Myxococcota bacterium]
MSVSSNILVRFFAAAEDRLAAMGECIANLADNPTDQSLMKTFKRDLHTLKGEARMLSLEPIELLSHACEEVIRKYEAADGVGEAALALLFLALDAIFAQVQARGAGNADADAEAQATFDRLCDEIAWEKRQLAFPKITLSEETDTQEIDRMNGLTQRKGKSDPQVSAKFHVYEQAPWMSLQIWWAMYPWP